MTPTTTIFAAVHMSAVYGASRPAIVEGIREYISPVCAIVNDVVSIIVMINGLFSVYVIVHTIMYCNFCILSAFIPFNIQSKKCIVKLINTVER